MIYQYPDAVLMIFCKAPVIGQVKTRLTKVLTAKEAMQVHIRLSLNILQLATQNNICPVQLWCAPLTDHPFFIASAQTFNITLEQQQGNDLGERMNQAFLSAFKIYSRALIIGCDCPSLTEQDLKDALNALNQENSCVLAPAEDGGYVLIGLNQPHSELFENMPWGTEQVLKQTRIRIKQYNFRHRELKEQWDVDVPEDLKRYHVLVQDNQGIA
ncbi:MAG: TIGR04282 family arsenosugar biosynthesis glycosyltransferase [Methylococcales bacterium]|nr:TIGR04282 family arsenosugar biosynthesis glycosyltransferase [Methylococcales bacterium]